MKLCYLVDCLRGKTKDNYEQCDYYKDGRCIDLERTDFDEE